MSAAVMAHAGPGASWQAMVVVVAIGLAVSMVLVMIGVLRVERPDDLVVPVAGTAVAASIAPVGSYWLSDGIGWAIPVGSVALVALVLAAVTPVDMTWRSPVPYAGILAAAVGAWLYWQPLTIALHPPPEVLPLADDSEVTIVAPADGATVPAGEVEVAIEVTGGSIGPGDVPLEQLPADPEQAGGVTATLDGTRVEVVLDQSCTVDDPCTAVTFPLEVEPGERSLTVEFTRGDGTPLAPFVADRVDFTAE